MAEGKVLAATYLPAFGTQVVDFQVAVPAVAARLGTLITVPVHRDRLYDANMGSQGTPGPGNVTRPYRHVFFEVPSTAANTVWMTFSNNTAPVVGGPGMELQKGVVYTFENAGDSLLRPATAGDYPVDVGTAFQLIATALTNISVWFAD